MFNKIINFFKSLWNKVKKVLKKIWNAIKPILPLLIFAAVFFSPLWLGALAGLEGWAWLAGADVLMASLGTTGLVLAGLGTSMVLDPGGTGEVIGDIATAAGDAIGEVAGGVVEGVATGLAASPVGTFALIGLGILAFMALTGDEGGKNANA